MKRIVPAVVVLLFCLHHNVLALERLAVLPLKGSGVETATLETVHMLLASDVELLKTYEVVPEIEVASAMAGSVCSEIECAVFVGRQVRASKIVFGSLNKLGDKIIFQYSLIDVASGRALLSENMSALRVEDLDQVTKRVALSIVRQVPPEKTMEVGLVTEQESLETKTRKASSTWGIGFGYLYPQKGYDKKDNIFVWDFRSLYEMRNITVDALMGIRQGFALNVGFLYLFGRTDVSPFIGAGLGFHAVSHEYMYYYYYEYDYSGYRENSQSDGIEILLKGGIMAFRTYDFRIIANVEYSITFNDYDDRAIVVTIGVMRAGKKVFGLF